MACNGLSHQLLS